MKVIINRCYGGPRLSDKAMKWLETRGVKLNSCFISIGENTRTNPDIIECIETLGSENASGEFSQLKVVEIPDDVDWYIENYDGIEHVAEKHRIWE